MEDNIKKFGWSEVEVSVDGQVVEGVQALAVEKQEHYDYDYKNVDWKAVKVKWDKNPGWFDLKIRHNDRIISFDSGLSNKTFKMSVFINGKMSATYCFDNHEYMVYMNKKLWPYREKYEGYYKKTDRSYKKLGREKWFIKKGLDPYYRTPIFDNVAQIKKMVTALQ